MKQTNKNNKKEESKYVLIKVKRTTRTRIKKLAKENGYTMSEYVDEAI